MRKLSLWLPVAAWCALIFALSSMPDLSSGLKYDLPLRKFGHMAEYGVLFALTLRALEGRRPWAAAAFCLLYAASDEWHQTFVGGRRGAALDVLIDAVGVAAGWILAANGVILRK